MISTSRRLKGGRVDLKSLPTGTHGRSLCRWCALEVPPGRFSFCSEWCVNEWRLRSDPGYLRERVFARDRGVCALCGLDTVAEWRRMRRLRGARRLALTSEWGLARGRRRSLWDADHIIPVVEGGGECDLDNIRTLCLRCHRSATRELRGRLKPAPAGRITGL